MTIFSPSMGVGDTDNLPEDFFENRSYGKGGQIHLLSEDQHYALESGLHYCGYGSELPDRHFVMSEYPEHEDFVGFHGMEKYRLGILTKICEPELDSEHGKYFSECLLGAMHHIVDDTAITEALEQLIYDGDLDEWYSWAMSIGADKELVDYCINLYGRGISQKKTPKLLKLSDKELLLVYCKLDRTKVDC